MRAGAVGNHILYEKMMGEGGYYWIPKDGVYETAWLLVMK
jgi:hypothetical protein